MKTLKIVLTAMFLFAASPSWGVVIYDFRPIISNTLPGAQAPQIEATFTDIDPGKVLLTVTSSDLVGGEFLADLYFNFDPADKVKRLHFTQLSSPSGSVFSKISTGEDSFRAVGYGYYDIHLNFRKSSRGRYFGGGSVTYQITEPGLNVSDFAFVDLFGSCTGSYYALACVRGICGKSEWLGCSSLSPAQPVPEPASVAILAFFAGLACCIYTRVKQNRRARN